MTSLIRVFDADTSFLIPFMPFWHPFLYTISLISFLMACANSCSRQVSYHMNTIRSCFDWCMYTSPLPLPYTCMMKQQYTKDKHMSKSACWRRREVLCLISHKTLYLHNVHPVLDADGSWTEAKQEPKELTRRWQWLDFPVSFICFFSLSPHIFIWWFTSIYHDGQRKDYYWRPSPVTRLYLKYLIHTFFLPSIVSFDTNIDQFIRFPLAFEGKLHSFREWKKEPKYKIHTIKTSYL